jgi:hypothetical protein
MGLAGAPSGNEKKAAMSDGTAPVGRLSSGEQRALASFLAGRLPAGQLHAELCRHREAALAAAVAPEIREPAPAEASIAVPALHAG